LREIAARVEGGRQNGQHIVDSKGLPGDAFACGRGGVNGKLSCKKKSRLAGRLLCWREGRALGVGYIIHLQGETGSGEDEADLLSGKTSVPIKKARKCQGSFIRPEAVRLGGPR